MKLATSSYLQLTSSGIDNKFPGQDRTENHLASDLYLPEPQKQLKPDSEHDLGRDGFSAQKLDEKSQD